MHRLRGVSVVVVCMVVWSLAFPGVTLAAPAGTPRFESASCPWTLADDQVDGKTVVCGYLVVPEIHATPGSPTIRLAVADFKSVAARPAPDPVIYLEGGPGGSVKSFVEEFSLKYSKVLAANRDFIMFDQRGVGMSQPAMNCPETSSQSYQDGAAHVSLNDAADHLIAAMVQCRDRLNGLGINLAAYNSIEGAADINDLRAAMGFEKVNLFGVSYGTRVALTAMRDFPQGIRSAVLDSAVPLEANLYEDDPLGFDRSLNLLFAACAADANCNANYPNVRADFTDAFNRLNAQPVTYTRTDRTTGKAYPSVFDGYRLAIAVEDELYNDDALDLLPKTFAGLKNGDTSVLGKLSRTTNINVLNTDNGKGAYFSVVCSEETPFNSQEKTLANIQTIAPELRAVEAQSVRYVNGVCAQWPTQPAKPTENQAVTSPVRALILTSENDPATPPRYGQMIAASLPNNYLVAFPGIGHSVVFNGTSCGLRVMIAFVRDPNNRPDSSCTSDT